MGEHYRDWNLQVARQIKVVPPNSSLFSVAAPSSSPKVAPGMEAKFNIIFRPPAAEDYWCDIIFCTEGENFTVPVRAVGARPRLTLPSVIEFGSHCPCNSTTSRSLLARNSGRCSGRFELRATPPFRVAPSEALLHVGETVQCLIKLEPKKKGSLKGTLSARSACGVYHEVELEATAVEAAVHVAPCAITFAHTFVTKTTQREFHIYNKTSRAINFSLHTSPCRDSTLCTQVNDPDLCPMGEGLIDLESSNFHTREISALPLNGVVLPSSSVEVLPGYEKDMAYENAIMMKSPICR